MPTPRRAGLARLFTALLVPAWIATGAILKLVDGSPRTLPRSVLRLASELGVHDLHAWLAVLIGIELTVAIVAMTLPRFGRWLAAALLVVFIGVLATELARGASHCGCLGAWSPPPVVMLGIDATLLAALLALGAPPVRSSRRRVAVATVLSAAAFGLAFGRLRPHGPALPGPSQTADSTPTEPARPTSVSVTTTPHAPALPRTWFAGDVQRWVGRRWQEIDLLRWLPAVDPPLDFGPRHVVFYRRSCPHCEEMFWTALVRPELARTVLAVEVPERPDRLRGEQSWPLPATEVQHAALPLGTDWIIETPLVVTLQDGVVTCAEEGDYHRCLGVR